jgi:hypothetical protein
VVKLVFLVENASYYDTDLPALLGERIHFNLVAVTRQMILLKVADREGHCLM